MHEAGADIRDIQAILGHAKLDTTQIYTRVSLKKLLDTHSKTHPAEQPEPDPKSKPNTKSQGDRERPGNDHELPGTDRHWS